MKKGNKKGFTLIELLAVIIILGVLMLLAVPSVSKFIERGRMNTYKSSVSSMVSAVSNEVNYMTAGYTFGTSEYLVMPFVCIDLERGDNSASPFGDYEVNKSFVLVERAAADDGEESNGFKYYVSALDESGYGTATLVEADNITIEPVNTTAAAGLVTVTWDAANSKFIVSNGLAGKKPVLPTSCQAFNDALQK